MKLNFMFAKNNPQLREEEGWIGVFTRAQAEGAIPNGTRVVKVLVEKGDTHPLGAKATVLGSAVVPEMPGRFGYFVEWDTHPRIAVFVAWMKIKEL